MSKAKAHAVRPCTEQELEEYLGRTGQIQGSKRGRTRSSVVPVFVEEHVASACQGEAASSSGLPLANSTAGVAAEIAPYTFEFGIYKKQPPKSLDEILRSNRAYVDWCVKSKVHHQYPKFAQALLDRGIIGELPYRIPKGVSAALVFAEGGSLDKAVVVAGPAEPPQAVVPVHKRRRRLRTTLLTQSHNCLQRGSPDHNISTCPHAESVNKQRLAVSHAYQVAGQEARRKASEKYTNLGQRTDAFKGRPRARVRATQERSFLALCRAPPLILARWLVEDGLLASLSGKKCEKPHCEGIIGAMVGVRHIDFGEVSSVQNITMECNAPLSWKPPILNLINIALTGSEIEIREPTLHMFRLPRAFSGS